MKESEKWLALCDPYCQFRRHFPNCVCCDIALEYRRCKSEEQAGGEREMTTVEKRKMLEAIDTCVRCDLFTEIEADKIMQICYAAIGRAIRQAEEGET